MKLFKHSTVAPASNADQSNRRSLLPSPRSSSSSAFMTLAFLLISTIATTTIMMPVNAVDAVAVTTSNSKSPTTSSSRSVSTKPLHKHILLDETFTSSIPSIESRDYMLTRNNWLNIVPECDKGSVHHHDNDDNKNDDDREWSITTNTGDEIHCSKTVYDNHRRHDRFPDDTVANYDEIISSNNKNKNDDDDNGCYLSYNVLVEMHKEGLQFTFDIEYDIQSNSVRRQVHSFKPIGWKSKIASSLIKSGLVELMQEENKRLTNVFNVNNPTNARILSSSTVSTTKR